MDTRWRKINGSLGYKLFLLAVFYTAVVIFSISFIDYINNAVTGFSDSSTIQQDGREFRKFREKHHRILERYVKENNSIGLVNKVEEISKVAEYYIVKSDGEVITNNEDLEYLPSSELYVVVERNSADKDNKKIFISSDWQGSYYYNYRYAVLNDNNRRIQANILDAYGLDKFVFRYKPDYAKDCIEEYHVRYLRANQLLNQCAMAIVAMVISSLLLTISAGRTSDSIDIRMSIIDKFKMEYLIIIFTFGIGLLLVILLEIAPRMVIEVIGGSNWPIKTQSYVYVIFSLIMLAMSSIFLTAYLSIVRRIKAKTLWQSFIVVAIGKLLLSALKSFMKNANPFNLLDNKNGKITEKLFTATLLYIVFSIVLTFSALLAGYSSSYLFVAIVLLEIIVTVMYIVYIKINYDKLDKSISERASRMIKAERTKTELITGVSHDLKTPLTSIVAYIDLLKKEELGEKASEYVAIIDKKANGLSSMVKDLFEIAKTASGEIQVEKKTIDVNKLVKQTLADMDDRITHADFDIRAKYQEGEIEIITDGNKLYRVVQNLIDNALKYSLKGSRIYIATRLAKKTVFITVKNTSAYELDMEVDELKKRFVRADESRTKEGSGLGLAISSTFITALGGSFDIVVDGDQFNAIIELPLADNK